MPLDSLNVICAVTPRSKTNTDACLVASVHKARVTWHQLLPPLAVASSPILGDDSDVIIALVRLVVQVGMRAIANRHNGGRAELFPSRENGARPTGAVAGVRVDRADRRAGLSSTAPEVGDAEVARGAFGFERDPSTVGRAIISKHLVHVCRHRSRARRACRVSGLGSQSPGSRSEEKTETHDGRNLAGMEKV
ncbi:uncharacterized protein N7459_008237 [Penicillium hispanicum]|uniref:uncharacterized protein n=1 Tax=Penicillium hispanicum TaxID=1080232 RepID=UPI0025414FC0|nr:uncharacterized protein N7459_008237 [Penicillium hispanicum]KAJ5573810.1 hypothetical protein N7459_008237 [Penicillium hispanicum]